MSDEAGRPATDDEVADTLGQLARGDVDRKERRRLLRRLAASLARSAKSAGVRGAGGGRWLTDLVVQAAPRVPIRDLATLMQHHDGLTGDELAEALVRSASRATAGIGAAAGALATAEWAAPPTLLSAPVQLVAETVAIAAVEIKLVAELHEAYGVTVPGSTAQRTTAFLTAWARRRGVDLARPGAGLTSVIGSASRRELRDQLMRRLGRNLTTLGPVFTGALIGAELNRRATRGLGEAVRRDLLARRAVR
ncbi:MAG: hypothetical protein DLM59_04005 [Pseudonocardiales bacterium]|nr:MAG: hypothetical protein DLM59_04005 [Pseudonocardiales bacterium]